MKTNLEKHKHLPEDITNQFCEIPNDEDTIGKY